MRSHQPQLRTHAPFSDSRCAHDDDAFVWLHRVCEVLEQRLAIWRHTSHVLHGHDAAVLDGMASA